MDEEKNEEMEALESESRDDARDAKYDDTELKEMISSVLAKLDVLSDGIKALFVSAPAVVEEDADDEESYAIEDLEF